MKETAYSVRTSAHFDRLMKKLAPKHLDLVERFEDVIAIISADPFNKTRMHPIKKLHDLPAGDGQYRIRTGRFRFRYDVDGRAVVLLYCGPAPRGHLLDRGGLIGPNWRP
jgi:mRNA-degrading endonuclease RelE of RelBE toxin-antitoxin system